MDFLSMTAEQVEALPEAKAQEVLDAWVKAKRAELPAALRASGSKPHARLAKKALYQLQSSGVTVEAPRAEAPPAAADEAPSNDFPAVLSMQLGTGERAFFFAVPMRGGGLEIFQGLVHDEFGLAQIGNERANRQLYRKRLKELESDPDARVMLVSFERLKLELGRAIALNERSKTPYGPDVEQTLSRLGITPQDPEVVIPPLEPGDAEAREAGASLHAHVEIAQWMPSEANLVTLTSQVDALKVLPISEEQKAEKRTQLAKSLAKEVFTPAVRKIYARRLWYTAELFDFQQRPQQAAEARAEARRLVHDSAPSRFAEELFLKVLATLPAKPNLAAAPMPKP